MEYQQTIINWLRNDTARMQALEQAAILDLNDWCLAAGFVRNLVWDKLHGYSQATPLNDLDLIYFDSNHCDDARDKTLEQKLRSQTLQPWSVKNQARMHQRNHDKPYTSSADAMRHWVELETAIGARLVTNGDIEIIAPLGLKALFDFTITLNSQRAKPDAFARRIQDKQWLQTWPKLVVTQ